jgi:hypothetical protein
MSCSIALASVLKTSSKYAMEMVHALFPRWRIPTAVIGRRSHATLHQFDDPLVLILDRVEQ